ncbi:MAG: LysM peptidoglycan-binding domain-containing protein, partial [Ginsengibacter sp.]
TKQATSRQRVTKNEFSGIFGQLNLGESYTSLFLGAVVVVIGLFLIFSFLKNKTNLMRQTSSTNTAQNQQAMQPKVYTVKQDDDLWHISQNIYGSGYNWVDLAQANNLTNPSVIYVGTKLTVPNVKPKTLTNSEGVSTVNKITGTSYTVKQGDYLWDIAVRAYGDGFKWVELAKANKLTNPDLIYSGNVLMLPR